MASPQIERLADSAVLKICSYVLTAVMVPLMWRAVDRLDRIEMSQNAAAIDQATKDQRLKTLESLVPQRTAQLAELTQQIGAVKDKVLLLEFRVQDIERPAKGQK